MPVCVQNPRSGKSALKWLLLIGLLCAQFAYASHQLTHDAEELGESCQFCTGFEQFENALADDVSAGTVPVGTIALRPRFNTLETSGCPRVYSARASP